MIRPCCICKREECTSVVRFPLLETAYPLGETCHASWRAEAKSLGGALNNPAKVHMAFRRWCAGRAT